MRDGAYIATSPIGDTTVPEIVRQMVGRDVTTLFPKQEVPIGDVVLDVEGLTQPGVFHDVSFVGPRRRDRRARRARRRGPQRDRPRRLRRRPVRIRHGEGQRQAAAEAQARHRDGAPGIALVPEDRRQQGLVLDSSVARNATLAIRTQLAKFGLITERRRERERPRSGPAGSR